MVFVYISNPMPRLLMALPWTTVLLATSVYAFTVDSRNDFRDTHPSGCEHIQRRSSGGVTRFLFVQPCSRDGTDWEQGLAKVKIISKSIVYVINQKLIDGANVYGYFCSVSSIPKYAISADCTSSGWRVTRWNRK